MSSPEPGSGRQGDNSRITAALLLIGAVAYVPAYLYAEQSVELNRGYRLGIYGVAVAAVLLVASIALARLTRIHVSRAIASVSVTWFVVSVAGRAADYLDVRVSVVGLAGLLAGAAVSQWWHLTALRSVLLILGFVAVSAPIVELAMSSPKPMTAEVPARAVVSYGDDRSAELPDLWFILLDGYPSDLARTQFHEMGASPLTRHFSGMGDSFNSNALSPYPVTDLSIPSVLEGRPLYRPGDISGPGDAPALRVINGGANSLAYDLDDLGYNLSVVENGWHLGGCATLIDDCAPPPLLDDQMSAVLAASWVGHATGVRHDSFIPAGVEHLRAWFDGNVRRINENGVPDAVFMHFMTPHPPFLYTSDCEMTAHSETFERVGVQDPYWGRTRIDARRLLFDEQVKCTDAIVSDLIGKVSSGAIVAVVGDHGPASMGQLLIDSALWSDEMVLERLMTLAAVRLPDECDADLTSTMGVSVAIRSCLVGTNLDSSPAEAFLIAGVLMPDSRTVVPVPESNRQELLRLAGKSRQAN